MESVVNEQIDAFESPADRAFEKAWGHRTGRPLSEKWWIQSWFNRGWIAAYKEMDRHND